VFRKVLIANRGEIALRSHRACVLVRIVEDHVRAPILDRRAQLRQRRRGVEAAEDLPDHHDVRLVGRELRYPPPDRTELLIARRIELAEAEARRLDRPGEIRRAGNSRVVDARSVRLRRVAPLSPDVLHRVGK